MSVIDQSTDTSKIIEQALLECCEKGDLKKIQRFIDANYDINAVHNGCNLLDSAIWNEHPKVIKLLLENGANPNLLTKFGDTPLHLAAGISDHITIKMLLNYGADPNLADKDGKTPLDLAKTHNKISNVQIMEEHIKNKTKTAKLESENSTRVYGAKFTHENRSYEFTGTQQQFEVFRKSVTEK